MPSDWKKQECGCRINHKEGRLKPCDQHNAINIVEEVAEEAGLSEEEANDLFMEVLGESLPEQTACTSG